MATLVPFAGLRYADPLRARLRRLVTPPYDIISPRDQQHFYRSDPRNIIRLEYGKIGARDTPQANRYTRARATLADWLDRGVLRVDRRPALYLLQTEYRDPFGQVRNFTGLIGRVKLEPLGRGSILPHERTFQGPKTDRLNLLAATGVSFSPVFALYRDSGKITDQVRRCARRQPWADFRDWSGSRQRLWVINRPEELRTLQREFAGRTLLIADGHHRYATALNYREQLGAAAGPAADYVMMCLAETNDPGLTVLPVYRLVTGLPADTWEKFRRAVPEYFRVEAVAPARLREAQLRAAAGSGRVAIGMLGGLGPGAHLLTLKSDRPADLFAADMPGASEALRSLDVVVIDQLLLNRLLGVPPGDEAGRLCYTKDAAEAQRLVARKKIQAAVLPSPPQLDAIWRIAIGGEVMPQKSTYFLPKLITGLVMNPVGLENRG
jgi:uncharacterized protein (DUF1015 family)